MNLVALYARVSKDICRTCGKAEARHNPTIDHDFKGQDPEAQLQPLREMCRMRGWTIVKEYIDEGWSGASESRPAFDELMAVIAATDPKKPDTRKFDGVVVWKFDRFFRSADQSNSVPGTGIGLSVVKKAAQAHHGHVWVISDDREGTTFFLSLPIAARRAQ